MYYICRLIFSKPIWSFCGGLLAVSMRMSSYVPTDGSMPEVVEWVLIAFAIFCGLSGVVYIVNDIVDRKIDQLHPERKTRPIAAGRLRTRPAGVAT